MERDKLIDQAKQLFFNHKQATALDEEYTSEIYDILVENGYIRRDNKEHRDEILGKATRIYAIELTNIVNTGTLEEGYIAGKKLRALKINEVDKEEKEKIALICKKLSIKICFDMNEILKIS
jgi:hypothetical protein